MTEFRGIIYKARNIVNGKIYIGCTEQKLEERRNDHIRNSSKEKRSFIFQKAIKKYTYHNFHWEIVDRSAKSFEELMELEIKYIAEYNSYHLDGHGYNMTRGGGSITRKGDNKYNSPIYAKTSKKLTGRKMSPEYCANMSRVKKGVKNPKLSAAKKGKQLPAETRRKIVEAQTGKKHSAEWSENISKALTGLKKPLTSIALSGRKHTPEWCENMSKSRKGKKQPNISKSLLGRNLSQSHKESISKTLKGIPKPTVSKAQSGQNNSMSKTNIEKRLLAKLAQEKSPL